MSPSEVQSRYQQHGYGSESPPTRQSQEPATSADQSVGQPRYPQQRHRQQSERRGQDYVGETQPRSMQQEEELGYTYGQETYALETYGQQTYADNVSERSGHAKQFSDISEEEEVCNNHQCQSYTDIYLVPRFRQDSNQDSCQTG